jgi:hypothetical protein
MSLTGAWAKLQMQMEMDRIRAHYDTQQKMLEIHKSMWDRDDKKNSDMLTIQNINKIVGKTLLISNTKMYRLAIGRIYDVIEYSDNRYEFTIKIETPDGRSNWYFLYLNREKKTYITYSKPMRTHSCWELSYEDIQKPNQFIVESIQTSELRDMREVERKISILMDKILAR